MTTTQIIIAEPGVPQMQIIRQFGVPRDVLFRALTEGEPPMQEIGEGRLMMTIDRLDLRHGGTWRFVHWDADGREYPFRGVFHGTPSPEGIIWTVEPEDAPGRVCLQTVTFEDRGDKTVLRQSTVYQSVEDRDRALTSGVADGISESMQRVFGLFSKLVPAR